MRIKRKLQHVEIKIDFNSVRYRQLRAELEKLDTDDLKLLANGMLPVSHPEF